MYSVWKQKCSLHYGLQKSFEIKKGMTGQVEHESHVQRVFYIDGVVSNEFLPHGQTVITDISWKYRNN